MESLMHKDELCFANKNTYLLNASYTHSLTSCPTFVDVSVQYNSRYQKLVQYKDKNLS